MRSTGRWVAVTNPKNDENLGMRMLYADRRGRYCIRYRKEWRLVKEKKTQFGIRYVLGNMI